MTNDKCTKCTNSHNKRLRILKKWNKSLSGGLLKLKCADNYYN